MRTARISGSANVTALAGRIAQHVRSVDDTENPATLPAVDRAVPIRACLISMLLVGLLAISGCEKPSVVDAPSIERVTYPDAQDVTPTAFYDRSCACVVKGDCAQLTDAIFGHSEVRRLRCGPSSVAGAVSCQFESRFINEENSDPIASEWTIENSSFRKISKGQWCELA